MPLSKMFFSDGTKSLQNRIGKGRTSCFPPILHSNAQKIWEERGDFIKSYITADKNREYIINL